MEQLLTTQQVMKYFNIKDSRTIAKFRNQGMKYIPIGNKEYRYTQEDIKEFIDKLKNNNDLFYSQSKVNSKIINKTIKQNYEKNKINLQLNRVV